MQSLLLTLGFCVSGLLHLIRTMTIVLAMYMCATALYSIMYHVNSTYLPRANNVL